MKVEDIDWDLIIKPLALMIATVIIAVIAIGYTSDIAEKAHNEYRRDSGRLKTAARNFRAAQEDQAQYQQYENRYQTMVSRGVIGEENRLKWVELLKDLNRDLKLPVLRYDIEPRNTLPLNNPNHSTGKLKVHETTMVLTLGLLHEGDLFSLEQGMRAQGEGLFEVRGCIIQRDRNHKRLQLDAKSANFEAICKLSWFTVEVVERENS